jgi:hypothetical protein
VPPFERDIAIWKMSCANTENVAVRKGEEDTVPVTSSKGGCYANHHAF